MDKIKCDSVTLRTVFDKHQEKSKKTELKNRFLKASFHHFGELREKRIKRNGARRNDGTNLDQIAATV